MANNNDKIWNRSLDDIMSESFGKYAKYIIQDRALPDVRDGLKPVQRRILHAMNELKIFYDNPYKKSARTVGEVIGKYHPHGDSSIYEAMVRMAQEWKNNIPLIDMQGNKGSIDGDSPAAMRYTECRLSKFGQTLLKDINKNTVKFINNFDDSEQEPTVLPSLIPNILINGATGIAAGYATNIPPFNPGEVIDGIIKRILNPNSNLSEIAKIIKGPDFPTGGIIQGKEFIDEIYKTGKGKFFIRAKIEEEPVRSTKNVKRLVVKEIPFDTNKAAIVRSLDEIKFNNELPGFKEVRDDSDKDGISIVLEFETEKDLDIIKTFLFKKTQLQISYNANMVLIKNRKPVQASLLEILDSFIEHANDVVIKAAQFDLDKSLARKEIIEGLIKAISEIDILVDLIKSSASKEEAKIKIQNQFKVNERQSEAIVNLRLYVLTSYDTEKLKKEYEDLLEFIKEKEMIINSNEYRNKYIVNILEEYKKQFAYKRKTLIEKEVEELDVETADIIEEIHGTCIVTKDNYIKFINEEIVEFDITKTKIKDADIPVDIFKMSTLDYLICLTNRGKVITIPAYKIKMTKLKDNGVHINELVTIDSFEKTVLAFAVSKNSNIDTQILLATRNSFIKRITLEDLSLARTAKYLSLISLKTSDDEVVSAHVLKPEHKELISVTENGFATKYDIDEIPIVGRAASGVKNMTLKDNDCIGFVAPIPKNENFLFFVSNRGAKRIHINDIALTSRSKLGKKIFQQTESNPYLVNSGYITSGRNTIYLLLENNELISLKVSEVPITDNESRMNLITKVGKNTIIASSYLDIEKTFIEISETNNFNTLSEEKQNKNEIKEKDKDFENGGFDKNNTDESKEFNDDFKNKKSYFINEDSLELEEKFENNSNDEENELENIGKNKKNTNLLEQENSFNNQENENKEINEPAENSVEKQNEVSNFLDEKQDFVEHNTYNSNLESNYFDDDFDDEEESEKAKWDSVDSYSNQENDSEESNEKNAEFKDNNLEEKLSYENEDLEEETEIQESDQEYDDFDENQDEETSYENFEDELNEDENQDEKDEDLEEEINDESDFSIDDINEIEEDDSNDYEEENEEIEDEDE